MDERLLQDILARLQRVEEHLELPPLNELAESDAVRDDEAASPGSDVDAPTGSDATLTLDGLLALTEANLMQSAEADASSEILGDLASDIANHYEHAAKVVFGTLRYALRNGVPRTVTAQSTAEATAIRHISQKLVDLAYIDRRWDGQSKRLIIRPPKAPDRRLIRFLDGEWLEFAAEAAVRKVARDAHREVLRGAKLAMPGGARYEIDVLAQIDGQLLTIECKSGDFAGGLSRAREVKQALGVPDGRALILVPAMPDAQRAKLAALHTLTFVDLPTLGDVLAALSPPREELARANTGGAVKKPVTAVLPDSTVETPAARAERILREAGLYVAAVDAPALAKALHEALGEDALSYNQLKDEIVARSGSSKKKANSLLQLLIRFKVLKLAPGSKLVDRQIRSLSAATADDIVAAIGESSLRFLQMRAAELAEHPEVIAVLAA